MTHPHLVTCHFDNGAISFIDDVFLDPFYYQPQSTWYLLGLGWVMGVLGLWDCGIGTRACYRCTVYDGLLIIICSINKLLFEPDEFLYLVARR